MRSIKPGKWAGAKGYTLVETMISVTLGIIVIAAVGSTLSSGAASVADNRSRLYATNALREEIETLRNTSYDTIAAYAASTTFTNAQVTHLVNGAGTRSIAAGSGSDIKKVTLTVSWRGRRGNTLSQSITTYITRRGLNGV